MKLICFIPFNEVLQHPYPDSLINERLREEQFDLGKMILQGCTLDGERVFFAQERFGGDRR